MIYQNCQVFLLDRYPIIQVAKMYNIQLMTLYPLKHGGYFTLFFCHFFPKTWGWVPSTRRTPNLISRNPPPSILNCFKITHNFPFNPKSTSKPTSVKPLYFLSKLNFQTIQIHPFSPIKIQTNPQTSRLSSKSPQNHHYNKETIHLKSYFIFQTITVQTSKIQVKLSSSLLFHPIKKSHFPKQFRNHSSKS